MLMPKKNRTLVYENLFKEGVIVVKKDFHSQNEQLQIPNLHVIKTLQSLKSRGYVTEQFVWRHYYWVLTNEGIQYLRDYLHLPPEIVPSTLRRQTKTESSSRPTQRMSDMPARSTTDRENYRRTAAAEDDKKGEAGIGANANLEFRGGFGRGRRQIQE